MCDTTWENDGAHAQFWRSLVRSRAAMFMKHVPTLKALRHNFAEAKRMQELFGSVWAEYGTDVYKLIAEACNESWDNEDEEKSAFARASAKKEAAVKQRDDDLVATREAGARQRQHELQGIAQESQRLLEKEEGHYCDKGAEEEEALKKSSGRRDDFYRRAGGT